MIIAKNYPINSSSVFSFVFQDLRRDTNEKNFTYLNVHDCMNVNQSAMNDISHTSLMHYCLQAVDDSVRGIIFQFTFSSVDLRFLFQYIDTKKTGDSIIDRSFVRTMRSSQ